MDRVKLPGWGRGLKDARGTRFSQVEAARRLSAAGYKASASLVAQLESGRLSNPDSASLRVISQVYGIPYDSLIGSLLEHKYGIAPVKANLLALPVVDAKAMAAWELKLKPQDLWVIDPESMCDQNEQLRSAAIQLLKRGSHVSYFVKQEDLVSGGRMDERFFDLNALPELRNCKGRVTSYGLARDELCWLAAGFVVANPYGVLKGAGPPTEGYTIICDEQCGTWGFPMSNEKVKRRVRLLQPFVETAKAEHVREQVFGGTRSGSGRPVGR